MKKLKDFTPEEKIEIFDYMWEATREEFNEDAKDIDEHDKTYFWENTMNQFLKLTQEDWDKHNDGKKV